MALVIARSAGANTERLLDEAELVSSRILHHREVDVRRLVEHRRSECPQALNLHSAVTGSYVEVQTVLDRLRFRNCLEPKRGPAGASTSTVGSFSISVIPSAARRAISLLYGAISESSSTYAQNRASDAG